VQRFPSHLQRVLQPAHEMLVTAGLVRETVFEQEGKNWVVAYRLGAKATQMAIPLSNKELRAP
jgi:hypothetical protein